MDALLENDRQRLLTRIAALETLQHIARDLTAELDLNVLLKKILQSAMDVSHSTAGSLFLHDTTTQELVFKVIVGGGGDALKEQRIPAEKGIAGQSFVEQRAIVVDNAEQDPRFYGAPAMSVGLVIRQLVAVPLIAQGKAIGVLEVMNTDTGQAYTQDDIELLLAFGVQSAVAIENARLYGKVRQERDRILAVEAAIRHELARDLHDGPAQMLSVLIMQLRYLREMAQREPAKVVTELVNLEAVAQKAMYQTRNILFDLRPVILEQRGLGPTLEQYVMRLRLIEPFRISLTAGTLRTRLNAKAEGAIFSIVQEAVNNAKKHANANQIQVTAVEEGNTLTITVRDDGRGFDVQKAQAQVGERGSFGLLNMKERAEIAHGRLTVESILNEGTTVELVVPLKPG